MPSLEGIEGQFTQANARHDLAEQSDPPPEDFLRSVGGGGWFDSSLTPAIRIFPR
jgi:hypothetical protein